MELALRSRPRRRWLAALLLPFAAALAVHAQASPTTTEPEPQPASLRVALSDPLPLIDPFLQNTAASNWILYDNIFEGLVRVVDGEPAPNLAVSWAQEDDVTWVFTLRPDVVFHDGSPLTASDVVASIQRASDHPKSAIAGRTVQIESVSARDPRHAVIRLTASSQAFLRGLAMVPIVARASTEEPLDPLIATGPYRIVRYEVSEQLIVERNDEYWGEAPSIGRAEFLFVADEAMRAQMLIDGEVDLANHLLPSQIARIESHSELWIESSLGTNVRILAFDTSLAPYSDPRVREAIDLAVDREALVATRYDGYARVARQFAFPKTAGYVAELAEGRRDVARARELVAAVADGRRIALRLHCGAPAPSEMTLLVGQLAEAGFDVEVVPIDWATLYPRIQAGEIPFAYHGWTSASGDVASTFEEVIHSFSADGRLGKENHGRYANADADRLIEASLVTRNPDARRDLYEQITRIVANDRPVIPLVRPLSVFGLRRNLAWAAPPSGALTLSEMSIRDRGR